jgi:hypothetical protein
MSHRDNPHIQSSEVLNSLFDQALHILTLAYITSDKDGTSPFSNNEFCVGFAPFSLTASDRGSGRKSEQTTFTPCSQ